MLSSRQQQQQRRCLFVVMLACLLGALASAFLTPAPRQQLSKSSSSRRAAAVAAAAGRGAARCQPLFAAEGGSDGSGAPGPAPAPAPEPKAEQAGDAIGPQQPPGAAPGPQQPPVDLSTLSEEERLWWEKKAKIDALRAKEVFESKETGDYECQVCGWKYQEERGFGPFKPGTEFAALPQDFKCPNCKANKAAFKPITVTIAGFSDNRQYGFGGNSLTSEQKGGLIFGGLFVFFLLFLSGYLLE